MRHEFRGYFILYTMKQVSSFGQIIQWLERMQGEHEVEGSSPTRTNFPYTIKKL